MKSKLARFHAPFLDTSTVTDEFMLRESKMF